MNFKVGEKVVEIKNGKLDCSLYLSNYFHNKQYVLGLSHIKELTAANENYCSFREKRIPDFIAGSDQFSYFHQDSGVNRCYLSREYNILSWDNNKAAVQALVKEMLDEERIKCERRIADKVLELQAEIAKLQTHGDAHMKAFKQSELHLKKEFEI